MRIVGLDHVQLAMPSGEEPAARGFYGDLLGRTHIGLDFFDATISRTAAWVVGTRNMQKALLRALLQPIDLLKAKEAELDYSDRFVLTEELKDLPYGAVWQTFCDRQSVPSGVTLLNQLNTYQASVADRT